MPNVPLPSPSQWGHRSRDATPAEIVKHLVEQSEQAIREYSVLPEGPEPCNDRDGYFRASVEIPITPTLFDQLMNGAVGYRAHYSIGVEYGEDFNRRLVDAVAPIIVRSENLYRDKFDQMFCQRSLLGPFSKFWFPKELTDPSAQSQLLTFKAELQVSQWVNYWRGRPKPRKGLLVPVPESMSVLLNGTFVNAAGEVYEQKPSRSKQIFDTGWT
jgi:hypothetical protein